MEKLISEIKPEDLKNILEGPDCPFLIDIREEYEVEDGHLNGLHIPMEELTSRIDEIPRNRMVVIYCNSGSRSGPMTWVLVNEHGFDNISSLEGGFEGYINSL